MNLSFFLAVSFCYCLCFSQAEENYFILKKDGSKHKMFPNKTGESYRKGDYVFFSDYALTGQFFYYHDEFYKLKKLGQSKVLEMHYNGRSFVLKGIKGNRGPKRLHEILVKTKRYIITQYFFSARYYVYIYDRMSDRCLMSKKLVSFSQKRDRKLFEEEIKPRFKNCEELMAKIEENLSIDYSSYEQGVAGIKKMFRGISNYKCN